MENNLTNQAMQESNVNQQPKSYADVLRETQQEEFPLLSEVTQGVVEEPITLMNSIYDEDGVVVPCALPDTMWKSLPQMISETLSLYDDNAISADSTMINILKRGMSSEIRLPSLIQIIRSFWM